jgi:hypothetical protein
VGKSSCSEGELSVCDQLLGLLSTPELPVERLSAFRPLTSPTEDADRQCQRGFAFSLRLLSTAFRFASARDSRFNGPPTGQISKANPVSVFTKLSGLS